MPHLIDAGGDPAETRHVARFFDAMREALRQEPTRTVIWQILEAAGVHRSVAHELDADPGVWAMYRAGKQDIGHALLGAVLDTDEQAYLLMQREARARYLRLQREKTAFEESRKATEPLT